MKGRLTDLTGQVFDRLTVLSRDENAPNGAARWVCRCGCGNLTTALASNLKNGGTRSCGCKRKNNRMRRKIYTW